MVFERVLLAIVNKNAAEQVKVVLFVIFLNAEIKVSGFELFQF